MAAGQSELAPGSPVRIQDLKSRPELNGITTTVGPFDKAKGRFAVAVPDGSKLLLKPENLVAVMSADESDDDALALESNADDDELILEGNDDDDGDDGPLLEENEGSEDEEDGLQLEENEDDEDLMLEDNDDDDDLALEDNESDDDDDGLALEENDINCK